MFIYSNKLFYYSRSDTTLVTVLCVRFGNKYGPEYVEKLRNMVSRHLTVPYEFVCLTDNQHPIEGVRSIILPNAGYSKGWWYKVHMFDPNLKLSGRILYFDLDVIIHDNINKLVSKEDNNFYGIRDFNRKFNPGWNSLNSSAMSWIAGQHTDIFLLFKTNPAFAQKLHGDQDWIWQQAKNKIVFWPDAWIQSYKWEIRDKRDLAYANGKRAFKTVINPSIPKNCSVTVFHGDPNPHEIQDQYVLDNWK